VDEGVPPGGLTVCAQRPPEAAAGTVGHDGELGAQVEDRAVLGDGPGASHEPALDDRVECRVSVEQLGVERRGVVEQELVERALPDDPSGRAVLGAREGHRRGVILEREPHVVDPVADVEHRLDE